MNRPLELVGHAVLRLHLAASEPDAALHVYLSEEEPDGTVRYVTEGVLRALHRKVSPCPPNYRANWPYHSCDRGDAAPLVPGRAEEIVLALLPTVWRFGRASRIRLAIAGADTDHTVKCRMAARPLSRSIGVSHFSICLACLSKRQSIASVPDKAWAMPLEVRSVENLLGTPVPYAYAMKAGPWLFLTGHEAYDWRTGMTGRRQRGRERCCPARFRRPPRPFHRR